MKPIKLVALVGRPNVGKSTLFNRLIRSRKAIVDPTPGVTRDRHYETVSWDEREFVLIDTGGIELNKTDKIPEMIREQSLQAVAEADIILFMLDAREGLLNEDYEVVKLLRRTSKPVFHLVNKIDGPEREDTLLAPFYELGVDELWPMSAEHGFGVADFFDFLTATMPTEPETDHSLPDTTIRVSCIGRPNVGKSSLVNRLLGQERMVVSAIPGTTRDAVDTLLEQNGKHYLLIDTAGIRRKGKVSHKLEKFSVMRALSSLEKCDIALLLIDAEEGITEQDTKVIGYALERGRACLVLLNKWDLIREDKKKQKWLLDEVEMATRFVGFAPTLPISALSGFGVKKILPTLDEVYRQYALEFSTNKINKVLRRAVEKHSPPLHRGRRLKLYYATQIRNKPPTFLVFANYPKAIHFSYYRFLANRFRQELGLDKAPIRILFRERKRKNPFHTKKGK